MRARHWLAAAAVLVQLLTLYLPGSPPSGPSIPGADKAVHVLVFALATWALMEAARPVWVPLMLLVLHAPVSEWVQATWIPYRTGDPADLAADLVGIALGVAVWRYWPTEPLKPSGRLTGPGPTARRRSP